MNFLRRRVPLVLVIVGLLVAFAIYYPYSPAGRQARNMKLASEHIAAHIAPQLNGQARYAHVRASSSTANLGCLVMSGRVESEHDLHTLRTLVESTQPPVQVHWAVGIGDAEE